MSARGRGLCLVGPVAPPSGGVASHVADLARMVRAAGGRVSVLDAGGGPTAGGRLPALQRALRIAAGLVAARLRGDLVHLHTNGHNPGSWRLAFLVAHVGGRSALLTLHSGLAPPYIAAHAAACRRGAARFGAVVCVSPAIAGALAEAGLPAEKRVVAAAFDGASLPLPLAPAGLAGIRARHAPLLCATLGFGREYGADVLLEGYARLVAAPGMAEAGLVLLGPAARASSLVEKAASLGLKGRLFCYADLDRAEALAVLHAADLFVRPTLADGDAVSLREALALGVRAIASDAAARPEGVPTFRAGDPAALAAAALEALASPRIVPAPDDPLAAVRALYRDAGVLDRDPLPTVRREEQSPIAFPSPTAMASEGRA